MLGYNTKSMKITHFEKVDRQSSKYSKTYFRVRIMMLNATLNNISVISWRSVLLVKETREPGENKCSLGRSHKTVLTVTAIHMFHTHFRPTVVKYSYNTDRHKFGTSSTQSSSSQSENKWHILFIA